ncbi:NUDIX domain-containing protein [Glycomyces buryatensis]|uniref:NUDIX domain-containing protein n=1 Tax=Glycomyces buryatensis TaxID=2570927 RepID=A0A4S8QBJ3_9ACTN|nr:NUDIX domain-containing protein [Glycomyces buryatensis]THV41867.1 NUDIX domain-containing protein [Glycomyces buryatensis]
MNDHSPAQSSVELQPRAAEPRVSARAVVVDKEGRVLLVRHSDNGRAFHVLPGGRVEPGETAAEAARREVREETGMQVDIGELLWVREYLPERHPGHPHHRTQLQQLQLYFKAQTTSGAVSPPMAPDRTQAAVVWHPLASVGELVLLPLGLAPPLIALGAEPNANGAVYLGDLP